MKKQLFSIAAFVVLCVVCAGSALAAHGRAWPLQERIAATGANAVYLKRGRPDAKLLRECAEVGVSAGCGRSLKSLVRSTGLFGVTSICANARKRDG